MTSGYDATNFFIIAWISLASSGPMTTSQSAAASAKQEVNAGVFGTMATKFDGAVGAFAYLLFILLYFPCVATMGAIVRETGAAWAAFVGAWTTGVAYTISSLFYQASTFHRHPETSLAWLGGLGLFLILVVVGLRIWGRRLPERTQARAGEVRL